MTELEKRIKIATGEIVADTSESVTTADDKTKSVESGISFSDITGEAYEKKNYMPIPDIQEKVKKEFAKKVYTAYNAVINQIVKDKEYVGKIVDVKVYHKLYTIISLSYEIFGNVYDDSYAILGGNYDDYYFKKLMKFLNTGGIIPEDLDLDGPYELAASIKKILLGEAVRVKTYEDNSGNIKFNSSLMRNYGNIYEN